MTKVFRKIIPFIALFLLSSCIQNKEPSEPVAVTSVSFDVHEQYLEMGTTYKLKATVNPKNATNKKLTWTSYNESVATVSNKGVVTPVAPGQTTIRAKSDESSTLHADCDFIVVDRIIHPQSVALNTNEISLQRGESANINATIAPSNATIQDITWSANNDNVYVDIHGRVTALHEGSSIVTAKTVDGNHVATCSINVTASPIDQWTILIYMCGANLESDYANETTIYDPYSGQSYSWNGIGLAVADIMEILEVPNKPDDVNIVIETGGANEWTTTQYANYGDYNISSSQLQIHHVENNKIVLDGSYTYKSMGLSTTLQSFVEYGLTNYPAQKTGLILWNHGGGMQGACFDEKKSGDGLEPSELVTGVSNALINLNRSSEKLEFIGYDCCLMQVQEIASINSQYFNYMITSQETESGTGWDYNTWVDDLYAGKSTNDILKAIADGFIADNGGVNSSRNDQTLSYLNLAYIEEYRTAWEDMAGQLRNIINNDNKKEFCQFIDKGKKYADVSYYAYGLFDSKNFIDRLANSTKFAVDYGYVHAVKKAHKLLVEYSICGKGAGKSYGLSMFWNGYSFRSGWYRSTTTYEYNEYSDSYGFTNWHYLNKNFGGAIEK